MAFDFNRMAGQAFQRPLGTLSTNVVAFNPLALALTGGQSAVKPLQNLADKAVGPVATYGAIQQPGAMTPDVAVPPNVQTQNKPLNWEDIISGGPAVARANEYLQSEQERAQAVKTAQAMYPIMSQAKKDEMQRNLAAAQIRANIATNSQLMLGGAQTAQQMGLNAAHQMGSALAAQYQYG